MELFRAQYSPSSHCYIANYIAIQSSFDTMTPRYYDTLDTMTLWAGPDVVLNLDSNLDTMTPSLGSDGCHSIEG